MKRIFVVAWIVMIHTFAWGQEKTIAYFDKDWKPVPIGSPYVYSRTMVPSGDHFVIRDYYRSGTMQMEAECSQYMPDLVRDGKATFYDERGHAKETGYYKAGKQRGLFRYYYENGKTREEREYQEEGVRYLHAFDENGRELLVNGNGLITDRSFENPLYMEIENHQLLASYGVTGASDTIYMTTEQPAEYNGGLVKLAQDLRANLVYPKSARRQGVEGTVYVAFVVNKNGRPEEITVVRGISTACDEESVRVVGRLIYWNPGVHKNRAVKSRFVLPIKFRLEG